MVSVRFGDRNFNPVTFTNGEDCALRLVDGVVKTSDNCPARNGTGSLTPDYNARPIDLYVSINYQDVHIPIRIADALEPGDENMVVDIPGDVSPTTFPQDRWVFDARAWLFLPSSDWTARQPHARGWLG